MDSNEKNNSSDAKSASDNSGIDPRTGGEEQGAPNSYDLVPVVDQSATKGEGGDAATDLPKGRKIESARGVEGAGAINCVVVSSGKQSKVGDSGLLDDFDEDADFTVDPQVDAALLGGARASKQPHKEFGIGRESLKGPPYVKEGFGTAEQLAMIAGGVFLAAIITTCLTATSRGRVWYADGISTAYSTLLHTLTGVLAVFIGAYVVQRPLGNIALAAARIGLAVCVFQLILHLNIPPSGRFDETLLAVAGYCGVLWGLFRFKRDELMVVVCSHASLWMIFWLSSVLYAWSAATIVKPTP